MRSYFNILGTDRTTNEFLFLNTYHIRTCNIQLAEEGQAVAVSVNDGRIFFDGSLVQENRFVLFFVLAHTALWGTFGFGPSRH